MSLQSLHYFPKRSLGFKVQFGEILGGIYVHILPALRYIPDNNEPTHAVLPFPSPKYLTNSPRKTPNV